MPSSRAWGGGEWQIPPCPKQIGEPLRGILFRPGVAHLGGLACSFQASYASVVPRSSSLPRSPAAYAISGANEGRTPTAPDGCALPTHAEPAGGRQRFFLFLVCTGVHSPLWSWQRE